MKFHSILLFSDTRRGETAISEPHLATDWLSFFLAAWLIPKKGNTRSTRHVPACQTRMVQKKKIQNGRKKGGWRARCPFPQTIFCPWIPVLPANFSSCSSSSSRLAPSEHLPHPDSEVKMTYILLCVSLCISLKARHSNETSVWYITMLASRLPLLVLQAHVAAI